MSKRRVLCKFFAHGECLKGENCEFSHDWKDPPNNICTFYQKGNCAYGSRCRYDHIKVSQLQSPASGSSAVSHHHQYPLSGSAAVPHSPANVSDGASSRSGAYTSNSTINEHFVSMSSPSCSEKPVSRDSIDDGGAREPRNVASCNRPLCSFAAAGNCPRGENCPHIHGDLCATCGKQCLHPFRPQEREEHRKTCEKRQKHLESLKRSQEIECSVCLERVLSKPTAAERKFGILSECDHPFCVSCIRYWRKSSPASGMDVNSTLRACPLCRKLSYFVVPSVIWYFSKKEKQEIIDSYKTKLRSIDCKHFDFGNGTCPFGNSCFYKHTVKRGSHMWHAALMPEVYGSRSMFSDEQESSSNLETNSLELLFELLNASNMAVVLEEFGSLSNEDIQNEIAEALAFKLMLESLGLSDSESDSDINI